MPRTSPALLLLPALLACGDKAEDTGVSDLTPDEGVWGLSAVSATSDSCGWEAGGNAEEADTEYALVLGEDSFTLGISGGQTIRWECDLEDSGAFSCVDDVESNNIDGDAVSFTQGFGGSFSSATTGEALISFESTCQEDDDCGAAAAAMDMPVPCGFEAVGSFSWLSVD